MRIKLTVCLLFVIFCFTKVRANNSAATVDTTKIIVACLVNDNAVLHSIKKNFMGNSLIKYNMYCINHSVFLLSFAGNNQAAQDMVQNTRKQMNLTEEVFFIKEFSFGDIVNFCETGTGINEFGNKN